jgi:hypothetical protein
VVNGATVASWVLSKDPAQAGFLYYFIIGGRQRGNAGYLYYTIGLARCQGQIRQDCQISALKITSCGHKEKAFKGLDFAARDCIIEA